MVNQSYNAIDTLASIVNFWLYHTKEDTPPKITDWEPQLNYIKESLSKPQQIKKRRSKKKAPKEVTIEPELAEWLSQEEGCPEACKPIRKHLLNRVLELLNRTYPGRNPWLDEKSARLDVHCAAARLSQTRFIDPITTDEKTQISQASRAWHQRYPDQYVVKTKEADGSALGIDLIVEKMKEGLVHKDEVMKLAQSNNMLSISVQINARLKKLGLKMKKAKRGGDTYYGVK